MLRFYGPTEAAMNRKPDQRLGRVIGVSRRRILSWHWRKRATARSIFASTPPGGNTVDGLLIYNALKSGTAPVTIAVDGMAASLIAMAATDLRRHG